MTRRRFNRPEYLGDRGKARKQAASLLANGPLVLPNIVGGDPFSICAWEQWMERAACVEVDPELFYPEQGSGGQSRTARRICGDCPVRTDCLDYALNHHEEYGIWGGLTHTQRVAVARQIGATA